MSTRSAIIRAYALQQRGAPYVYGATGQPCTPKYRQDRQKQYPQYAEAIAKQCPVLSGYQASCNGCKHNGRLAFDCAQLTRRAQEAAGYKPASGSGSQWRGKGWAIKGPIEELPPGQVAQLFRVVSDADVPHTGIALGDGTAIDARSHSQGVVHQPISKYPWTHYAIRQGQEAETDLPLPTQPTTPPTPKPPAQPKPTPKPEPTGPRTLRVIKGQPLQRGEDVREVQHKLIALGYSVGQKGPDGVYGWDTDGGVRSWQMATARPVTGVLTPDDISALLRTSVTPPAALRYTATLTGLTDAQVAQLLAAWPSAIVTQAT